MESSDKMPTEPAKPRDLLEVPADSSIRSIRYLTCQGGGMKGIGDVGALEELEKYGVLAQLEEVAGASAGGLIATLVAMGCTTPEIRKFMVDLDFKSLQDKAELNWIESTQMSNLASGLGGLASSAADQVNILEALYPTEKKEEAPEPENESTLARMEDLRNLAFGSELGIWEGEALSTLLGEMLARKTGNPNITFRELAELSNTPGSPFKKITLVGSNITDKVKEYYNVNTTPDMPVRLAARISAGFPGAFKPIVMLDENGNKKLKVDGGLMENLPDIFNHPPYITEEELKEKGGNPNAFALIFENKAAEKNKTTEPPKNGIGLAGSLFKTKMSEEHLEAKYGTHIARVDTLGVDTLEFNLPHDRKMQLIDSGGLAVHEAFSNILAEEKKLRVNSDARYANTDIKELVRIEIELKHERASLKKEGKSLEPEKMDMLTSVILEITNRKEKNKISHQELVELEMVAEKNWLKKERLLNAEDLDDKALSSICAEKQKELVILNEQIQQKINELTNAKHALEFESINIMHRYDEDKEFNQDLKDLKILEENVKNHLFNSSLDLSKMVEANAEAMEKQKVFCEEMIKKYQDKNDELLVNFFTNIQADSLKPGFEVPSTIEEIEQYCARDINECAEYIAEAKQELEMSQDELRRYQDHQRHFATRTNHAERYSTMLNLNRELDKSILRKTTLITKLNNYIIQRSPKFSKVMTPFLKMVSVLAFVCYLPLAIPAVSVAKAIQHFSANKALRKSADKLILFFSMSDIDGDTRLRLLRDSTRAAIKNMKDQYTSLTQEEMANYFTLESKHLKNGTLDFEDILIRNEGETQKEYRKRVDDFNKEFQKAILKPERSAKKETAQNFNDFKSKTLNDTETELKNKMHEPPTKPKAETERQLSVVHVAQELNKKFELTSKPEHKHAHHEQKTPHVLHSYHKKHTEHLKKYREEKHKHHHAKKHNSNKHDGDKPNPPPLKHSKKI